MGGGVFVYGGVLMQSECKMGWGCLLCLFGGSAEAKFAFAEF